MRSPFARARISSIDAAAAERHPGVAPVYTCDNIGDLDLDDAAAHSPSLDEDPHTQRPLARGDVYYVGQCVAMVVAVDRYVAEDAAALIEVDYEPLDGGDGPRESACATARRWSMRDVTNNIAAHFVQVSGNPEDAFATRRAHHQDPRPGRSLDGGADGVPGGAASWDQVSEELTVWDGTQAPISVRGGLASSSSSTRTRFASLRRMSAAGSDRRFCCSIPTSCSSRWRP